MRCSFYGCEAEALTEDKDGFCREHSHKQWYTVQEAAAIWSVHERTWAVEQEKDSSAFVGVR